MGPFGTIAGKLANSSCLMQKVQKFINRVNVNTEITCSYITYKYQHLGMIKVRVVCEYLHSQKI